MVVSQYKSYTIVIPPRPNKFSLMCKTNRFFSSGGVVGRTDGAKAGDTCFESQPVQDSFSFPAELCQNTKIVSN